MSVPIVVFHASCPDGFGAAWWLGRQLGEHEKVEGRYGEQPPDCAGRDVYVVDFCYPTEDLDRIAGQARSLLILDHHQTSFGWVAASSVREVTMLHAIDFARRGAVAVLDVEHSGIGLVADYVNGRWGSLPRRFMFNIEDRDLWQFKLWDTPAVFAAVTSRPYTVEAWDEMLVMPHEALLAEGSAIERYRQQLIAATVATARYETLFGFRVAVAAAPYAIGSDVAGVLAAADPHGFAGYYVDLPGKRRWGLRSAPDTGMDVAVLAESLGGGGHRHAAGFEVASP